MTQNSTFSNRPVIGLVPSNGGDTAVIKYEYLDAVWQAGGLPVTLSYTTDPAKLAEYAHICDGFLFTGGVDLHPSKYGETIQFDSVSVDEHRDAFEEGLFAAVYPTRKPILGICRGIQSINVWLGGSLHQHIDGHRQEPHRVNRTHPITIYEGSMLHAICGKTSVMVNSAHHQVLKDVANQLVVDAVSPEGYVEAAHQPDHPFLFAVQFHPEAYYHTEEDDHAAAIFKAFVGACGV
jgi:putative glutamine amidotransferase